MRIIKRPPKQPQKTVANRATRRAARRRTRALDPKKGFTPDLLDGVWESIVETADRLQTSIIRTAANAAIEPRQNRPGFLQKLRNLVAFGTGQMVAQAKQVERNAEHLGRATATHIIDQNPTALRKLADNAPKPPRNPDTGATVRTPKGLQAAVKDMAPTLYGSGTLLYDDIIRRVAANPPESDTARRRIAQKALDEYKQRGITGLVDKGGRRWNMVSYIEMATRTAASDLAMRAHIAELQRAGLDVVRVTVMPNCHPYCQPYQGRLLSITGATRGTYDGERIVASLPEALAHGFRHPSCRHSVRAHLPGMKAPDPDTIDPGDYKATQELRAIERNIRREKRARDTALTPEAKAAANRAIQQLYKQAKQHTERTGIPRNRWREQVQHAL